MTARFEAAAVVRDDSRMMCARNVPKAWLEGAGAELSICEALSQGSSFTHAHPTLPVLFADVHPRHHTALTRNETCPLCHLQAGDPSVGWLG